jgi:hypothetical protein
MPIDPFASTRKVALEDVPIAGIGQRVFIFIFIFIIIYMCIAQLFAHVFRVYLFLYHQYDKVSAKDCMVLPQEREIPHQVIAI